MHCGNEHWTEEDMRREAIERGFDPDAPMHRLCDDCYLDGLAMHGVLRLLGIK
jgi:hypothetical protein